jgi:hypothetical protein
MHRRFWLAVFVFLFTATIGLQAHAVPFPANTSLDIGAGLPTNFEPSGGAWQTVQQKLYVVGDNGAIASMNADGTGLTTWNHVGDWEGVAVAQPSTNLIYVVNEGNGVIREFDTSTGVLGRSFNLTAPTSTAIGVTPLSAADLDALVDGGDGTGTESLAFVPNLSDPEGGLFYAGSQENGTIYQYRLALSGGSNLTYMGKLKTWPAGDNDLSGLEWDWQHNLLLAVWDSSSLIRALSPSGTILAEWTVPGGSNDEEGIAYNGTYLFISEDPAADRDVIRYSSSDFNAQLAAVPEPTTMSLVSLAIPLAYIAQRRLRNGLQSK